MSVEPSTFVISITPFTADGEVDYDAFRSHLRRLRASGIGVYVGGSGSGEGYTLSTAETEKLLCTAVEELKGHVPVRAMGVEPRTAKQMIAFLNLARECGVDAAQLYSLDVGHDVAPAPEEIERYLTDVLSEAPLPVIISTHFSVGFRMAPALLRRMAETYAHVIGVNCTHPDLSYVAEVVRDVGGKVPVMVGGPMQGLTILALGGHGYLSSEGNVAPNLCVSVIERYKNGDMEGMMSAFGTLIKLFGALQSNGGTRVTKAALTRLGLPGGYPRAPRLPIDDDRLSRALEAIQTLKIGEIEGWELA